MTNRAVTISVVVPLYNEASSLPRLLQSLGAQTRQPDEIVLVDAGSSDATAEVARTWCARLGLPLRLVESRVRLYPGAARNLGVREATSEYIAFTDAGIALDPRWLEALARHVEDDAALDLVFGHFEPREGSRFQVCVAIASLAPTRRVRGLPFRHPCVASLLIRRAAFERAGGFIPTLRSGEDLRFLARLDALGLPSAIEPAACARWSVAGDLRQAFRRFRTYARFNARAGLFDDWQRPVLRKYAALAAGVAAAAALTGFVTTPALALGGWWALLLARAAVAMRRHRGEYPAPPGEQLLRWLTISAILGTIDLSMFIGTAEWLLEGAPVDADAAVA